jgi:hypothetical protein
VSGTFTLPPQASANVGNPPVGYYRFFVGDGSDNTAGIYYKKDSTGTVTALVPASYTDEQAQDAIGALLADSNNIDVTYNDAGNVETIVWRNPWMGLITGASKTYAATDIGGFYTRSNAGAAMTDTLPALTAADNGYSVGITNLDTAGTITFSTASPQQAATFANSGVATYVLQPNTRQTFIWTGAAWQFGAGNANLTKSPSAAPAVGDFAVFTDTTGRQLSSRTLNPVTVDTAQVITGQKNFGAGLLTMSSTYATLAEPYSDANPPETLAVVRPPAVPGSPTSSDGVLYIDTDNNYTYKYRTGAVGKMMTSAQVTTLANLWYDVTNYGVSVGNTGAANVAALQALVSSAPPGSTFFFPSTPANYPMVGTVTISKNYQTFRGAGQIASVIFGGNTTGDLFFINDGVTNITFEDLGFWATATATSGAMINAGTPGGTGCSQLYLFRIGVQSFGGSWYDVVLYNGSNGALAAIVEDSIINNFTHYGLAVIGNTTTPATYSALMVNNLVMNGNINGSSGAVAGIYIQQAGAVQIENSDIIQCNNNMLMAPITSSAQVVASVFVVNTYFDSSYGSCVKLGGTQPIVRCKFIGCSFTLSGNAAANSAAFEVSNTAVNAPAGIDLIGCSFFNTFNTTAASNGILLTSVADIQIIDSRVAGWTNGINATPNAVAGATRLSIIGNTIGPTGAIKGNTVGVLLNAGASPFGMVQIIDNVFGNASAYGAANGTNITDNSTVVAGMKLIANNMGLAVEPQPNPAAQVLAATTTYVTPQMLIPANGLRVGTTVRFTILASNAATINNTTILGKIGTAGTTADTTAVTTAATAGSALVGAAQIEVTMTIRSIGAAGVVVAAARFTGTGGFVGSGAVSQTAVLATATVNTTVANYLGVAITASAASVLTVQDAFGEVVVQ